MSMTERKYDSMIGRNEMLDINKEIPFEAHLLIANVDHSMPPY